MTQDEILSGAQATQDIASAMLRAAGECLKMHGNDPTAPAIMTAAVCLLVSQVNQHIDPTFKERLLAQLCPRS